MYTLDRHKENTDNSANTNLKGGDVINISVKPEINIEVIKYKSLEEYEQKHKQKAEV